ncbi:MAG: dihydroorotate dehydrogenase electron transfer subunit [Firmicutes bacterium]|nr:dihydroorotate dehydrogenase electron transfer subunit [Bacillota bacterium]
MKPIDARAVVQVNDLLTARIYRMELSCPGIAADVSPGQFVHVQVPGYSLRRPFTVAGADKGCIEVIYRAQGAGTRTLTQLQPGDEIQVLGPLGRGFEQPRGPALLLGGGIGTAALLLLARRLEHSTLVMGGRNADELWLDKLPLPAGTQVHYVTDDGSRGQQGTVLTVGASLLAPDMWVGACGPRPMLRAVQTILHELDIPGQFALEERMACGMGACMGCTCTIAAGPALVCKDGPVFAAQEVKF